MERIISKLTKEQKEKFQIYYDFLINENKLYNLTSITDINEVYIKHFYDSFSLLDYLNLDDLKVLDIGSGAGFPGIPLKIMNDKIKLTIIEPTLKRINFLKELCKKLDINDVVFINKRAEDITIEERESFDCVVIRAVSNLKILLELCVPYLKVNAKLIAYKGKGYLEELEDAQNALKVLKCKVINIYKYNLFNDYGERALIEISKLEKTDFKYPRLYAKIKNKPL